MDDKQIPEWLFDTLAGVGAVTTFVVTLFVAVAVITAVAEWVHEMNDRRRLRLGRERADRKRERESQRDEMQERKRVES